jgi:hypothetical protein
LNSFESIVNDIVRRDILGLPFEVEDQAMSKRHGSNGLDVIA